MNITKILDTFTLLETSDTHKFLDIIDAKPNNQKLKMTTENTKLHPMDQALELMKKHKPKNQYEAELLIRKHMCGADIAMCRASDLVQMNYKEYVAKYAPAPVEIVDVKKQPEKQRSNNGFNAPCRRCGTYCYGDCAAYNY